MRAVLNPLHGMLNAIAYGGVCQWCGSCLKQCLIWSASCLLLPRDPRLSWSDEYIDVDFRVGCGNIQSKRSQCQTPSIRHQVKVTPPFMAPVTMVTQMHMLPKMCLNSNLSCHFLIIVLIVFSGSTMFILTT